MVVMAPLLLMVVVLFFLSRADKKKRAALESTLKKGDRVVTRSGLIGKLTEVSERTVRLEVAPGVHVTMLKTALEGLDGGDTVASAKADDKDGKDKSAKADDKDGKDKSAKADDKAAPAKKDASDKAKDGKDAKDKEPVSAVVSTESAKKKK